MLLMAAQILQRTFKPFFNQILWIFSVYLYMCFQIMLSIWVYPYAFLISIGCMSVCLYMCFLILLGIWVKKYLYMCIEGCS